MALLNSAVEKRIDEPSIATLPSGHSLLFILLLAPSTCWVYGSFTWFLGKFWFHTRRYSHICDKNLVPFFSVCVFSIRKISANQYISGYLHLSLMMFFLFLVCLIILSWLPPVLSHPLWCFPSDLIGLQNKLVSVSTVINAYWDILRIFEGVHASRWKY